MSNARAMARLVAVTALIVACGEAPTHPVNLGSVHVTIVSGDAQTGSAGQELPLPLVVKVVGSNGKGIRGQIVNFRVTAGGGRMYAGSSLTDMNGVAQDYWTLGAPGAQMVEVVAVEPTTGAKQNFGSFTATALSPAALSITPASGNFGSWPVGGTSGTIVFTIQNTGNEASGPVSVALGGTNAADFAIAGTTCGAALTGSATCTVTARFSPTSSGSRNASLTASASPGGSASSSLTGTGVQVASLTVSPPSLNFGSLVVGATSSVQNLTIQNTGTAPASGIGVALGGTNPTDFLAGSTCTGVTINPGQTCVVGVQFRPAASGARAASLNVTASGGASGSSSLSGTGIAPAQLTISPPSLVFPSEAIGDVSPAVTFTVTNTGQQTSGTVTVTLTGAHPQDFNMPTNMCIGQTLIAGQSCIVVVNFSPTAAGARSAILSASASPGGTVNAALGGTGSSPTAQLSITPLSQDFGTVLIGSPSTRTFTLSNSGQSATGVIQLSLTGTNVSQFALVNDNCSGVTLNTAAQCTVQVTLNPTSQGTLSALLTSTATPGGTLNSSLTGMSVAPAQLSVTPSTLSFGNQVVRTNSASQRITITNTGTMSASPIGVTVQAATSDFLLSNSCTLALGAGASCTIDVVFSPTVLGTRTATLVITAPGFTASVALGGTGI